MRKTSPPGATLIELLFLIAFTTVGCVFAIGAAGRLGWVGYPLGFAVGFLLVPGALFGFGTLYLFLWPDRPVCRNGCCESKDYDLRRVGEGVDWFCKCGVRYRNVGSRFYAVAEDGSLTPFRVKRVFRGWHPDERSNASAAKRPG